MRLMIAGFWSISLIILYLIAAGCVTPSLPNEATREFQGTYDVSHITTLEVYNQNGAVEVTPVAGNVAFVNATLSTLYGPSELDRVQIRVNSDELLRIETVHPIPPVRVRVNYQITIPPEVSIRILESSNGGIAVRNAGGNASLTSSNGPIAVDTFTGDIAARTSNGAIVLSNINGTVTASTSNAEISLQNVRAITLATTSNAKIDADIRSANQDVVIRTSNAHILVRLAPDLDADLSLSTSNGQILLTNIPVTVSQATRTELQGTLGSGGNEITVNTSNADIEVILLPD